MSNLQEVIVESTIRAFNAGYNQGKSDGFEAGLEAAIKAAKFVMFEHHDLEIIGLSDFEEELKIAANSYQSAVAVALEKQAEKVNA